MTAPTVTIRVIVVPTDFSECSRHAVEHAANLAEVVGAQVVLLHVGELPIGLPTQATIRAEGRDWRVSEYIEATAARELETLAEGLRRRGLSVGTRVETGPPATVIRDVARSVGADLIVLGTHGRTGLRRALLGSVAERVLRHSGVPVLTVRSDGDDDEPSAAEAGLRAELDG